MAEQPRVPAGSPEGGQWTSGTVSGASIDHNELWEGTEALRKKRDSMSGAGQIALQKYWNNYTAINTYLREGKAPEWRGENGPAEMEELHKALDQAFTTEASKLAKPRDVYRGLMDQSLKLSKGDIVEDKGFVSTTIDPDVALGYADRSSDPFAAIQGRKGTGTMIRIRLPKGTRYLPGAPGHSEVMLNRGSRFRVLGQGKDTQGRVEIEMELINETK